MSPFLHQNRPRSLLLLYTSLLEHQLVATPDTLCLRLVCLVGWCSFPAGFTLQPLEMLSANSSRSACIDGNTPVYYLVAVQQQAVCNTGVSAASTGQSKHCCKWDREESEFHFSVATVAQAVQASCFCALTVQAVHAGACVIQQTSVFQQTTVVLPSISYTQRPCCASTILESARIAFVCW